MTIIYGHGQLAYDFNNLHSTRHILTFLSQLNIIITILYWKKSANKCLVVLEYV